MGCRRRSPACSGFDAPRRTGLYVWGAFLTPCDPPPPRRGTRPPPNGARDPPLRTRIALARRKHGSSSGSPEPMSLGRGAMPELPGPPVRPQHAKRPGCARLLLDHIRWGRELVRRVETGWDDEANDACRAWPDRPRQLLRFLLVADELYEHLRAAYARMCLRHALCATDQHEDLKTDLRELESVARELGLRAGVLQPDAARLGSAPGADAKVLVVHGRNREVKEQV